jgi:Mrp family chromosome partitioning ATPase/capsular polysaccharide biosynthesis protein
LSSEELPKVRGLSAPTDLESDVPVGQPASGRNTLGPARDDRDSLREYLAVLGRHRLVIAVCALATPFAAFVYSARQDPVYEASAAVLVTTGGAGSVLSEIPGIAPTNDPERLSATHLSLARLPVVARATTSAAGLDESPAAFLGRSAVTADADTDILRFTVSDTDPDRAQRLATAYAAQFTRYRNGLDMEAIRTTRATITQAMAKLVDQGQRGSALYAELALAVRRLDAAETVQGSAAVVVQPAISAVQVSPRTKRNVALGLVLGLLYGVGLAFLIERLATRVRSPEELEALVGLPALGELPRPPDLSKFRRRVSMLDIPHGAYAESVRKLRANVEFASLDTGLGTLMVTSPVPGDGKTTVSADLAVAFARSGRRVALCDLDARSPSLGRQLGLDGRRGLADIALGVESLDGVLVSIPLSSTRGGPSPVILASTVGERSPTDDLILDRTRGGPADRGQLNFLPFGSRRPHDPGDFVSSRSVRIIVAELRESHDIVVIDTAPLLPVSDSRAVSEYVDAALIVCGLSTTTKPNLRKIHRLLSVLPTRVFGVVVTGVAAVPGYGYGGAEEPDVRSTIGRLEGA